MRWMLSPSLTFCNPILSWTSEIENPVGFALYTLVEEPVYPDLLADIDGNCILNVADFLVWVQEWLGGGR